MHSLNAFLNSHSPRRLSRGVAIALLSAMTYGTMAPMALAQYNPPADLGLPERREPGGTRGGCPSGLGGGSEPMAGPSLTPLVPQQNHFGQTVSPYPTFYWYVPEITAQSAEFVLMDDDDNEVYTTKFQLDPNHKGGLVSLSLPDKAGLPPLEVGQTYRWYFSLICDEFDRGTDIFTDGWVRRVDPPTETLATSNDYAQAGIWFEALELLAEDRRAQSGTTDLAWQELLTSVGLGGLTDADFVE